MTSHEIASADALLAELARLRAALTQADAERDEARRWARAWKQAAHAQRMWANVFQRAWHASGKRLDAACRELATEKAKRAFVVRCLHRSEQMRREAKRRLAQVCALIKRAGV